jgi:hypothetical protein
MKIVKVLEKPTSLPGTKKADLVGDAPDATKSMTPSSLENSDDMTTSIRPKRLGFLAGRFDIPSDFDQSFQSEIERLFNGDA